MLAGIVQLVQRMKTAFFILALFLALSALNRIIRNAPMDAIPGALCVLPIDVPPA